MIKNKQIIQYLKTRNSNAKFIDKLKIYYRPYICPFNILLEYVNQDDSVFDIGCGSGQFCSLVAHFKKPFKIKGIEIYDSLIKNANELNNDLLEENNISFDLFDGMNIPPTIIDFNKIFIIDVLHHIPPNNQTIFLQNLFNKMKNGSILILKDINAASTFVYFNKLHDYLFSNEIGNEWTLKKATSTLIQIGFQIIDIKKKQTFLYPHYCIICKK